MSDGLLLDTNVLLWTLSASNRISTNAKRAMTRSKTVMSVSVVSIWEIILKHKAGKLIIKPALNQLVDQILYHSPWTILQVCPEHLLPLIALPMLHKDPFDRLLIAQARHEGLTIVTSDELIRKYDVHTIW